MRLVHTCYTNPARFALVQQFNKSPGSFDFTRLLEVLGHSTDGVSR